MESLRPGLSATAALLTVELALDAVAAGKRPPAPVTRAAAERLAQTMAADLTRILGEDLADYGLIAPGALYDIPELLRPGLPFISTLLEIYRGSLAGKRFRPQVVAIGSQDGRFPIASMAPARRPGSGPLLVVPILLVGSASAIDALEPRLEERLLEKGTADIATEQCLREDFQLAPVNLSYATVNDLCALMKIQLEHNGLDGLWSLLESALYRPEEHARVTLPSGNAFLLEAGVVYTPFYSFGAWAQRFGADNAVTGYEEWVMRQRQYTAGLEAHGLDVQWVAADESLEAGCAGDGLNAARDRVLADQQVVEETRQAATSSGKASIILLTEQATPVVGAVAYSVLVQGSDGTVLHLGNEYPLMPQAILNVRDKWAEKATELGVELHLARPGRFVVSDDGMDLVPDFETVGGVH